MQTTEDKTYNGWANYETWNVALWLGNDQASYLYWRERTQSISKTVRSSGKWESDLEAQANALAAELKSTVEADMPDLGASMASDLLSAALSEVHWYEIACNWLSDLD